MSDGPVCPGVTVRSNQPARLWSPRGGTPTEWPTWPTRMSGASTPIAGMMSRTGTDVGMPGSRGEAEVGGGAVLTVPGTVAEESVDPRVAVHAAAAAMPIPAITSMAAVTRRTIHLTTCAASGWRA